MQPPEEFMGDGGATETKSRFDTDQFTERTADFARQDPMKAVGIAFVAGLILTLLPIGAMIAGLVRLAVSLVRPALMILGATKVYDEIQKRNR
ncbi:MAG TPA: hypothetical protein VGO11_27530 [Chthoniobacteraceae bacterium]|jgi:hypothetical protein|nr:hypothetical protein [Chthoniobacteraceae bacterium]